jgi:hypothetical protein
MSRRLLFFHRNATRVIIKLQIVYYTRSYVNNNICFYIYVRCDRISNRLLKCNKGPLEMYTGGNTFLRYR